MTRTRVDGIQVERAAFCFRVSTQILPSTAVRLRLNNNDFTHPRYNREDLSTVIEPLGAA